MIFFIICLFLCFIYVVFFICFLLLFFFFFFFFFQAEDGIRDGRVTGVQTCALPILPRRCHRSLCAYCATGRNNPAEALTKSRWSKPMRANSAKAIVKIEIGRASCRERV